MNWDVFWSVLFVMFIAIPLMFIWAFAIIDLFRRRDLSGLGKVVWLFFIIFLPLIGTISYYLVRPTLPVDATPEMAADRAGFVAEKLTELTDLRAKGVISQEEFDRQRSRVLALEGGTA